MDRLKYFCNNGLLVLFVGTLTQFPSMLNGASQNLNSPCAVNDWRSSPGNCKLLRDCGSALSDLRSGIKPRLCDVPGQKAVVCCPSTPRKSEKMCEVYKEILREPEGPTPLLPVSFLTEERPREIQCNNRVNKLIVGGRDAQIDEFPHMVALGWGSHPSAVKWQCGATLISEEFLLTAAHCIETKSGRPSYALLGDIRQSSRLSPGRIIVKIEEYIKHPEYKKPLRYNDIGLLRLETKVKLSRSVLPACLPQPNGRMELKTGVSTTGWGALGTADNPSDILQVVNLTRFGVNECNEYFTDQPEKPLAYPEGIIRSQLCAGDHNHSKDSCRGDSGGPLTITSDKIKCIFHIIGITSFGSSICGIQPGVYTNVQSYLNWIEETVWP